MAIIETERLYLSPFQESDAADMYEYAKNPNVGPIAGWAPHKSVEDTLEIIHAWFMQPYAWTIRLKGEDKMIGAIALEHDKYRPDAKSKEIGYSLSEDHWGKGIMTEAAKAVMEFGFKELDLEIIGICTGETNKRSQRVIEKCGFKYEGTIRKTYEIYDGTLRDSLVFSILREEYDELYK